MRGRETWMRTPIFACGRVSHSIMSMTSIQLKRTFMNALPSQLCGQSLKDTMRRYLPMGRQAQEKPIQWKALSIVLEILKEVSFQDQWKRSSASFKCSHLRTQLSWSAHPTYKSITKLYQICSRSIVQVCKFAKTKRRVSLWRV